MLGARTMSLYTYIDSKDDLLDLMADQIVGEVLITEELPGDWREAITLIARRERQITLRTGLSGAEHLSAVRPYLQQLVDSGEFANIAPLLRGDVQAAEAEFERGLRWLLDGIERAHS